MTKILPKSNTLTKFSGFLVAFENVPKFFNMPYMGTGFYYRIVDESQTYVKDLAILGVKSDKFETLSQLSQRKAAFGLYNTICATAESLGIDGFYDPTFDFLILFRDPTHSS